MEKVKNSYESLFIVNVQNGEAVAKETVSKFTAIIEENAEIVEANKWGKRRLAYPINDQSEGYYTVITFKSAPEFPTELERLYNIDENIMRSMTIRLDHEAVASEKAAPAVETEATVVEEVPAQTAATEEVPVETVATVEVPVEAVATEEVPAKAKTEKAE